MEKIKLVCEEVKNIILDMNKNREIDNNIDLLYSLILENSSKYNVDVNKTLLLGMLYRLFVCTDISFILNLLEKYQMENEKDFVFNGLLNISMEAKEMSLEELCVYDAMLMINFYRVPELFRKIYLNNELSIDDGINFISSRLENSYSKMSIVGKEIIKPYCEASRTLIKRK